MSPILPDFPYRSGKNGFVWAKLVKVDSNAKNLLDLRYLCNKDLSYACLFICGQRAVCLDRETKTGDC